MILTGKAKEDFLKSHYKESLLKDFDLETVCFIFNILPLNHQYSDIIEWFDSVGIQIEVKICHWNKGYEFLPTVYTNFIYEGNLSATCCIDRKTATKQAIIKANEIYNERDNI